MNAVSLFSGIGGMDYGLHRAGFRHLAFCESDAYRRDVLAARWPGVPVFNDVGSFRPVEDADAGRLDHGELGGARRSERAYLSVWDEVSRSGLGLLCGGFPCQDLSVAGQRRGLMHEGGRSNLFFEFARIAGTLRPRWLLVENVPGLLSSNGGRDFGVVLGTLADLGYGVAWRVLDSRFFGVPQRRRRVFVVGALADGDPRAAAERAGQVLAVGSRCPGHPATGTEATARAATPFEDGTGNGRYIGAFGATKSAGGWRAGPDEAAVGQLIASVPGRLCMRCGDPSVYTLARGWHCPKCDEVANTMKSQRGKGGGGIGSEETLIAGPIGGGNDGIGRRSEDDPNLVAVGVSENQRDELLETTYAHQLTSGGGKPGQGYGAVREGASVRRLMPVECERLQAMPDGWTDLGATADSKRYAALGDAVTASVAEWLGRRIAAA